MKVLGQFRTQLRKGVARKPLLLARLGMHFAKNVLHLGSPWLRSMDVMINTECNCNCAHCFAKAYQDQDNSRDKLTLVELKCALGEAVDNGVCHFALQGGEPFVHPHLDEIIKACRPSRSYVTIVTNGTIATQEILRRCYCLGADKVAVSIDSFFAAEHDKFRGLKGAHDKAFRMLMLAREVGLDVSIAVTVQNETLHTDSVQNLFEFAERESINVDVNIPQPVGNWDGRTDLLLEDRNFDYLRKMHERNVRIRRDIYYHMGRSGCPAVKETLYMNVYGDIFSLRFHADRYWKHQSP